MLEQNPDPSMLDMALTSGNCTHPLILGACWPSTSEPPGPWPTSGCVSWTHIISALLQGKATKGRGWDGLAVPTSSLDKDTPA